MQTSQPDIIMNQPADATGSECTSNAVDAAASSDQSGSSDVQNTPEPKNASNTTRQCSQLTNTERLWNFAAICKAFGALMRRDDRAGWSKLNRKVYKKATEILQDSREVQTCDIRIASQKTMKLILDTFLLEGRVSHNYQSRKTGRKKIDREEEAASLLLEGKSLVEIAKELHCSKGTAHRMAKRQNFVCHRGSKNSADDSIGSNGESKSTRRTYQWRPKKPRASSSNGASK